MKKILISSILAGMMCATMATAEVYATVDGQKITEKDVNGFLMRQTPNVDFNKLSKQDKERIINELVMQRLILSAAKKDKIDEKPEYKELLNIAKQGIAVDLWLKQQGVKFSKDIKISQDDAKKYFENNPNQFIIQQAHLRQIVVKTKEEADKILAELKGKKGDALQKLFIELANKTNGSQNGGDLGQVFRGQFDATYAQMVFSLQPQTYTTTPIAFNGNYLILFLQSKSEEKKMTFAESEEAIKNFLINQKIGAKLEEKMKQMREKAKITINPIK